MSLNKKQDALQLVREVSQLLNEGALMPGEILKIVLKVLDQEMGFHHSMILLVDASDEHLICVAARGVFENERKQKVPLGHGIIGMAASTGSILRINNIGSEVLYTKAMLAQAAAENGAELSEPKSWAHYSIQSQMAIPLRLHGKVIGVLSVQSDERNAFDELDEELLLIIANQTTHVVHSIRNEALHHQKKMMLNDVLTHLQTLQTYMESLTNVLPGDNSYSKAAAMQLKGLAHLAMGESHMAMEQMQQALQLWSSSDLPLDMLQSGRSLPALELPARAAQQHDRAELLSRREREVAQLAAVGLSNAEIAEKLYISNRTVTTHMENIYKKLDLHSRAALAHYMSNL